MPTTFVRLHPEGSNVNGAGVTSVSTTLSATVPAGNLLAALVCAAGFNNGAPPPTLSKPVGESASWVNLGVSTMTESPGTTRSGMQFWAILTTVPWASGTTVTASGGFDIEYASLALSEWQGVDTTILNTDNTSLNENSSSALSLDTGAVLQADDVVLSCGMVRGLSATMSYGGTATAGAANAVGTSQWPSRAVIYPTGRVITGSGNRTVTLTPPGGMSRGVLQVALKAINYAPNAPTLTTMASGGIVNRGLTQRAAHVFSDPNTGDTQSKFDLRYRIVGDASWTTITQTTPNQFYDFAPGSLAAGDYERQVRTYDALGAVGPWSTSGFFTAADAPDGPTITAPVNGSTIDEATATFTWSSPDQDAYQVRKVADDAGDPDTSTVYYDTGEVTDSTTRSVALDFPTNGRTEHLQVRVNHLSLWSDWASIVIDVDYTEPPTPTFTLSTDADTGSLLVSITTPDPAPGDPAAVYADVYLDDGNGEERRATGVSPNGSWRYWTPISGRDYSTAVRVVTVAASGASASSV